MPDDRLLGARVYDSDDDDPDLARVVAVPEARADEWEIGDDGETCAEHPSNAEYDADAPIAVVVFEGALEDGGLADWNGDDPLDLGQLAEQGVQYYAFPLARLVLVPDDAEVSA